MRIKFLKDYKIPKEDMVILKNAIATFVGLRMTVDIRKIKHLMGDNPFEVPVFDVGEKWVENLKKRKIIKILRGY